jgi:glycosyltransferase involved in cell wall biosynthesis
MRATAEQSILTQTDRTAIETDRNPLVSIIVPFLNAERFIGEAIESVFAQVYDNWELLLVDDGSTDGSTDRARELAERYPEKVRYLEHDGHQNRGLPASRNLGLKHARGKYVALLDSDDAWLPQKLEQQVQILESHPEAAMVYGRSEYWRSWTGDAADAGRDCVPDLGIEADTLVPAPRLLLLSYPLGKAPTPCPSDMMLLRSTLERVGGFEESFNGPYTMYEDQAVLAKIYLEEGVFVSGQCWDNYRLHPDSCVSTVTRNGQYEDVRRFFFKWFEGYLIKKGIRNSEIGAALKKALRPYRHPVLHKLDTWLADSFQRAKNWARALPIAAHQSPQPLAEPTPGVGKVDFGDLKRVEPISHAWGYDRGRPVDRYYIENFLAGHADDIRGRTLEIGDDSYTRQFGGDRVAIRDVLHVTEGNAAATIVADLVSADNIPSNAFDCIILTQTLHLVYDTRAALRTLHRILKPGGVLLATFPGISQLDHYEWAESWYWGFTTRSARRLFAEVFSADNVEIRAHGNVLAAVCFLHGLSAEELRQDELDHCDPHYELSITVRAVKREG